MLQVLKRNGKTVPYEMQKIRDAVAKSGLGLDDADLIALRVDAGFGHTVQATVEEIQDSVEKYLMLEGFVEEAKAFILYRAEHAKLREGFPETIDGEPFGYKELQELIDEVSSELTTSSVELLREVKSHLPAHITYKQLLDNLAEACKRLCSPDNTDWSVLAGRWLTLERQERIGQKYFIDYFIDALKTHWKHDNFKLYDDVAIYKCQEMLRPDKDYNHSFASVEAAHKKYLHKDECLHHMFMGNAMVIAAQENRKWRMSFLREVYESLSDRKISLATPWVISLRAGGNISSCFIIAPQDNLESIMHNATNEGLISKAGGGVGIALSWCRAKGSDLMGNPGAATGILGWAKIFNDIALYVNQGGKRAGAATLALPIWHADIEDFLEIQTELGDLRSKCYDIEPQVLIPDIFMRSVIEGGCWYTFCPYEVEMVLGICLPELFGEKFDKAFHACCEASRQGLLTVSKSYDAKSLLKLIMARQFETGMPYIAFIDEINKHNPNKHEGIIPCTNLCVESFSVVKPDAYNHCCNLGSLVVGRISESDLEKQVRILVRILDNGIELSKAPTSETLAHNQRYRTIGVGIQGLHDKLVLENKSYNDLEYITGLAERIMYFAVDESITLAAEHGAYPAFKGSEWQNGNMISKFKANSVLGLNWGSLQERINRHGIRNSQLFSPPPNSSTSILMDACAGIMPNYAAYFVEDNTQGKTPVFSMHLKTNPLGYAKSQSQYNQVHLTKVVGALQKFVDTGISAEYIFDPDRVRARDLYDLIISAWKEKTKAIYYIRTDKDQSKSICVGCAG